MEPVRTEAALRAQLAKQLNLDDVQDAVWNYLVEYKYVEDALVTDDGWEALVRAYRDLPRFGPGSSRRASPGRTSRKQYNPRPDVTDYEESRAIAFSWVVAEHAEGTEHVQQFREMIDGPITVEEARRLVASPAVQLIPLEQLRQWNVPLFGHESFITRIGHLDDERDFGIDVQIDPPGLHKRVIFETKDFPRKLPIVAAWMENDEWQDFPVSLSSDLSRLPRIGEWLADQCPWSERDAVWFVLTGTVPIVPILKVNPLNYEWIHGKFRRQTISLTVEPWVSAETVMETYRWAQHLALGRDRRDLSQKSRDLLAFVLLETKRVGHRPPWKDLMREWNKDFGLKWGYTNPTQFARDYRRVEKAVILPENNRWSQEDQSAGT